MINCSNMLMYSQIVLQVPISVVRGWKNTNAVLSKPGMVGSTINKKGVRCIEKTVNCNADCINRLYYRRHCCYG